MNENVKFASVRIISDDAPALVAFYEKLLGTEAQWLGPMFAAFRSPSGTVAIANVDSLTFGGTPGIATPASNGSVFVEFIVADVDTEYARIAGSLVTEFVLEPTDMPWGNRSTLFRDPDGNLVNLFAPLTDESKARNA
jgi:catechol 2,3-dioxygenase-like lactoylglutathione lyase family enzyme